MRAAVYHGPRDVRIESMPEPAPPAAGELLLDVRMAAVCGTDASEYATGPHMVPLGRAHSASGHQGPTILGHEFVGVIADIGPGVTCLAAGDRVVCGAGVSCGGCSWCLAGRTNLCTSYYTIGLHAHGGLAERVAVPAATCCPVPSTCTDEAAAMAQPLAVAIHAVGRIAIAPTDDVVILGIGGIGAFILAAASGRAGRIIAVDLDARRLETAVRLGADAVVDASAEDAAQALLDLTGGDGAGIVVEASGAPQAPGLAARVVRRGGRIGIVGLQDAPVELDLHDLALREVGLVTTVAHVCSRDLPTAVDLLATTDLAETALDRVLPLDELVPEGLQRLAEGTAAGKILVDPRR